METDIVLLRVSLQSCTKHFIGGMLADLVKQFEHAAILKGELVLLVGGADKHATQFSIEKISELLRARMHKMSLRDAVKEVEDLSGLSRKQIYQLALSVSKNET